MKSKLSILLLAGMILAGCSQKSPTTTANLVDSASGMRADEVLVARQTSVAILTARMHQKKDQSMQTVTDQMAQLRSGLDDRARLIIAAQTPQSSAAGAPTTARVASPEQEQQQLESNASQLMGIIANARSAAATIGPGGRVGDMPAESMRSGISASLDRIQATLVKISRESGLTALNDIKALEQRLTPQRRIHSAAEMNAPTMRVRMLPGVQK